MLSPTPATKAKPHTPYEHMLYAEPKGLSNLMPLLTYGIMNENICSLLSFHI